MPMHTMTAALRRFQTLDAEVRVAQQLLKIQTLRQEEQAAVVKASELHLQLAEVRRVIAALHYRNNLMFSLEDPGLRSGLSSPTLQGDENAEADLPEWVMESLLH